MRHPRIIFVTALVIAMAVTVSVSASPVAASAEIFNGHVSGSTCGAGPNLTGGPFLSTTQMIAVSNPGGGFVLTCQFQYPAGSYPTSMITVIGFACAIWPDPGLLTFDSLFIAAPGGRATLRCRL
jgi:hypothetical protein